MPKGRKVPATNFSLSSIFGKEKVFVRKEAH
jgi:hypothetical protein